LFKLLTIAEISAMSSKRKDEFFFMSLFNNTEQAVLMVIDHKMVELKLIYQTHQEKTSVFKNFGNDRNLQLLMETGEISLALGCGRSTVWRWGRR